MAPRPNLLRRTGSKIKRKIHDATAPRSRHVQKMASRLTAADLPELEGSIFIVTYGRSGSTLLQSILSTIPGAHIAGENFNTLFALFAAIKRARNTKRTWGKKRHPHDHPWHGANKVDPAVFEQTLINAFVGEFIRPPRDARWIGFKEIRYAAFGDDFEEVLKLLRRTFPNAFFVFNSRAPGDVSKSKWWAKQPEDKVKATIATMDKRFADYFAAHPDHSHHVFHDQTVADPESLRPLFDKIGEPFDSARIRAILDKPLTH